VSLSLSLSLSVSLLFLPLTSSHVVYSVATKSEQGVGTVYSRRAVVDTLLEGSNAFLISCVQ
jgi:hypothetical protein